MLGLRGLYSAGPQKSSKPVAQIVLVASRRVSIVGPQLGSKTNWSNSKIDYLETVLKNHHFHNH